MNAREAALQAAHSYWSAQGLDLRSMHIEAHQAPLPGSVWDVRGTTNGSVHLVLVTRTRGKRSTCLLQNPCGYTVYGFSQSGERPLAIVSYACQAKEQIEAWWRLPRFVQVMLGFVENTSPGQVLALKTHLAVCAQRQERAREQRQRERVQRAYGSQPVPLDPTPYAVTRATEIAPLLWRLLDAQGLPHSRGLDQKLLAFLDKLQRPDGSCLPFGYAWTHFQQMLLIPYDPQSASRSLSSGAGATTAPASGSMAHS